MATPNLERRNQWQEIIDAQMASGKTQVRFCTDQGINLHNFQYWRRRLTTLSSEVQESDNDIVQLSNISLESHFAALSFETEGIRIPLADGTAWLNITGKLSVAALARLLDACRPGEEHHVPA